MQITFSLDGKEKRLTVKTSATLASVLKAQGVNEETGLVKLNGKLCHPLEKLKNGDKVEFINVIYGG